jgi:hypothetical protein
MTPTTLQCSTVAVADLGVFLAPNLTITIQPLAAIVQTEADSYGSGSVGLGVDLM